MTRPNLLRRTPSVVAAAVTAGLAAAVLAGCGSDGGSGPVGAPAGGTSSGASSTPSPAPTDGKALVQSATDALNAAESFHIAGTIAEDGDTLELDITYGADGVAQGTLDDGKGSTVELRRVSDGTTFVNGSSGFYERANSGGDGPDLTSVADKWVRVDDDAPAALTGVADLLDRKELASSLEPDGDADEVYEVSGPEDVDGTAAYIVTDKDGDTFAVAAEGDPVPLEITNKSDDGGGITFDGYGDDVSVDAPDDSEIVELPAS